MIGLALAAVGVLALALVASDDPSRDVEDPLVRDVGTGLVLREDAYRDAIDRGRMFASARVGALLRKSPSSSPGWQLPVGYPVEVLASSRDGWTIVRVPHARFHTVDGVVPTRMLA